MTDEHCEKYEYLFDNIYFNMFHQCHILSDLFHYVNSYILCLVIINIIHVIQCIITDKLHNYISVSYALQKTILQLQ